MGGDYAPGVVVEGVLHWLSGRELGSDRVVLYGVRSQIREALLERGSSLDQAGIEVVDCSEVIDMHDHPMRAISRKEDSSIVRGFQDLARGGIDGFASAGNTGAMMAGTMIYIKAVPGILRPSIASPLPVEGGTNVLLDVGLNSDCKPEVLCQYGVLGSLYSRLLLGVESPRVGLLNIGAEAEKGNLLTHAAYELMAQSGEYEFVGNVEGNELFSRERVDVVVCDGFVGNVLLKLSESFYHLVCERGLGGDALFGRFNLESYGGTPVLGVNRPVIIAHGASSARVISMMVERTSEVIASQLCDKIRKEFSHE